MKPSELMVEYLRLPAREQRYFDRFYADRPRLQGLHDLMAKAKPEQLRRVREVLDRKPEGPAGVQG